MLNKNFLVTTLTTLIISLPIMGDWEDRKGPPPVVHLTELVKNAESWLDIPVRIPIRFAAIRNIYTPYFTSFDRDRHLNFSAWDVHTHVWKKEGFMSDFPFFYVEKDAKEFKAFLRLKRFDTIVIMAKIVSIFKGKPYIRIVWMCKQDGDLNVHNLSMLNKASNAYDNSQFDTAITYYQKIFKTNPPEDIKALLHKSMGKVYLYNKRNYQTALNHLQKGLDIAQNDQQLLRMRSQCEYYLQHGGEEPQPIQIKADEIEDFEFKPEITKSNYTRINTSTNVNNTSNNSNNTTYSNTTSTYNGTQNSGYSSTQYDQNIASDVSSDNDEEFSENDEEFSENDEEFSENDEEFSENDEEFSENDEELDNEEDIYDDEEIYEDGDGDDRG